MSLSVYVVPIHLFGASNMLTTIVARLESCVSSSSSNESTIPFYATLQAVKKELHEAADCRYVAACLRAWAKPPLWEINDLLKQAAVHEATAAKYEAQIAFFQGRGKIEGAI